MSEDGGGPGDPEETIRAFVGVPLEPSVRERLEADVLRRVRSRCGEAGWRVRWVPADNLHLTLEFLGSVEPDRVEPVIEALRPVSAHPPFAMRLEGVGSFPPVGRPRVVWLGVGDGARDLRAIAADVEARLEILGFSPGRRPFHPHLTLGRVKRARGRAEDVLHPLRDVEGGTSQVTEIVLYRSQLRRDGSVYTPLARISLEGQ